jgi:hypothetical protein
MICLAQRAGDRETGGVMTGPEDISNGPVSCPLNADG